MTQNSEWPKIIQPLGLSCYPVILSTSNNHLFWKSSGVLNPLNQLLNLVAKGFASTTELPNRRALHLKTSRRWDIRTPKQVCKSLRERRQHWKISELWEWSWSPAERSDPCFLEAMLPIPTPSLFRPPPHSGISIDGKNSEIVSLLPPGEACLQSSDWQLLYTIVNLHYSTKYYKASSFYSFVCLIRTTFDTEYHSSRRETCQH